MPFVDHQGTITLCNLQAANDLGVIRDEIIGRHIREGLGLSVSRKILKTTKVQ